MLAIASDHAGYEMKEALKKAYDGRVDWLDLGTHGPESVDYPDYARALAKAMMESRAHKGVLVCGTGVGMSMAANRFPEIRAALCVTPTEARLTRAHNDANVLCLGSRIIGIEVAKDCLDAFLMTPYEGGRHQKRVEKLSATN